MICLLAACSKRDILIDVDTSYVGLWVTSDVGSCARYINIESSGDARYYKGGVSVDCKENQLSKGVAKTDGECIYIGSRSFPIKTIPVFNQTSQTWVMELEVNKETKEFIKL